MRNHSKLVWFLSVFAVFVVFVPSISLAKNDSYSFTKSRSLSVAASLDGVSADDAGIITRSALIVSSNKRIKTEIDLYKKMAIIRLEPTRPLLVMPRPQEITVTLSGLIPDQTYYLYKEKLHNPEVFTPGQDGSYSFLLETPRHRYLILKTNPSTYHIDNNATGGDCPQIGTWDDNNDTCTLSLTATIDQIIEIDDTNITLDGNGRLIAHADSIGIYANPGIFETVKNITVKNVRVAGMDIGISLIDVSDSLIDSVTVKSDTTGISLKDDEGMFVQNSTVWSNQVGFTSTNGTNIFLRRNNFKQNVNDLANISGDLDLEGSSTTRGNWWEKNVNCVQDSSNPSYCTDSYTTAGHTDNLPWFCEDAWVTPCAAPPPPPPPSPENTQVLCSDGLDNDADGLIDLADPDCAAFVPSEDEKTWAEISSTTGTTTLYLESAHTTPIKELPAGWVLEVLDETGSYWKVKDTTDDFIGYMDKDNLRVATDSTKIDYEGKAKAIDATVADRKQATLEVLNHYLVSANNTLESLYGNEYTGFKSKTFVTDSKITPTIMMGLFDHESAGFFDNELVTYDYGHGIGQITVVPGRKDVQYLQKFLIKEEFLDAELFNNTPYGNFGPKTRAALASFAKTNTVTVLNNNYESFYYTTRAKVNEKLNANRANYSNIPTNFSFEEYLPKSGVKDRGYKPYGNPFDNRGVYSKVVVKPCKDFSFASFGTTNDLRNCYQHKLSSKFLERKEYKTHLSYNKIFKWYANTKQSVFANVKDGLGDLIRKYYLDVDADGIGKNRNIINYANSIGISTLDSPWYPSPTTPTTDKSKFITPREVALFAGIIAYNQGSINCSQQGQLRRDYLKYVAEKTGNYDVTSSAKMLLAHNSKESFDICSPAYLQIFDSNNNMTGYNGSVVVDDIATAIYDDVYYKSSDILVADDIYRYRVIGTASDTYEVYSQKGETLFSAVDIPTSPNTIHEYTFDWNKLANGENGATIKIDQDGDGMFERTVISGTTLTAEQFNKITICHHPLGNPENAQTITIGVAAVQAHLKHGDTTGVCSATNNNASSAKTKTKKK